MRMTLRILILLFLFDCSSPKHRDPIREINQEIAAGNFTRATRLIDSLVRDVNFL